MNVRITYFCVYLFFISTFLTSCQSEDMYIKNEGTGSKSDVKIKNLKGLEAKKAENLLKSVLEKSGGLTLGSNGSMRTDEETIDYNNILFVLDTLGIKNYTFKILNHPDDNYKTFHNLILTDKDGLFELTVMKYEMTESFAQDYTSLLKNFYEFEGRISALSLNPALDPCAEIISDYPATVPNPDDDDDGGGSGAEPPPTSGPGDGNPGDGGSVGGGTNWCVTTILNFVCSCNRSYGSWDDYLNSMCGDGSNPGFTVTMVVSFSLGTDCRLADDPCSPDGVIGVIDPEEDCNTFEKRIRDLLNAEGGFTNDPTDPGGATNMGISWKVWVANANTLLGVAPTIENLQSLTENQAKIIYKGLYWDKISCDNINDGDLRYLLFDFYVNAGGNAVKALKNTLNSLGHNLTVNSEMDYETITAINNHADIVALYNTFKINRKDYYDNIVNKSIARYLEKKPNATQQQINTKTLKKYQNGWLNRVNSFQNKTIQNPTNVNC